MPLDDDHWSRRRWLSLSLASLPLLEPEVVEALQHAHQAARSGKESYQFFDSATAAEVEALASAIIPSGDTPGAREAGVIWFIDRALASFDQERRKVYKDGIESAQAARRKLFPSSASLSKLNPAQASDVIRAIEKSEFFETLRVHTLIGFLANPSWGGNRNQVGWKLIGFEDRMVFKPPFGWYDTPGNFPEEK